MLYYYVGMYMQVYAADEFISDYIIPNVKQLIP